MKTKFNSCLCSNCIFELIKNPSKITSLIILFITLSSQCFGQFHAAPGSTNTSAMYKDSSAFIAWAKTCTVIRGWQDASNTSLGTATVGIDDNGTLKAGDNPVVSLGDGGFAILTFSNTIKNGSGNDFAVFENAFTDEFLELAFVDVSSDGSTFVRFPATSNTQTLTQVGAFDPLDCTKLNNLAGKYRANYGTPFDLEEIKNSPGLDVNAITHVRIWDVVGSLTYSLAKFDINNTIVNDPFPTAFGSGGFDLDAIGVINENPAGLNENFASNIVRIFPNPCSDKLFITVQNKNEPIAYKLTDAKGVLILDGKVNSFIDLQKIENGVYFLELRYSKHTTISKVVVYH